jgi:TonB-linked SusC/RagA family outer membrane protein
MKTHFFYFLLILLSALCFRLPAQDKENFIISGEVRDSITGETLAGVNIFLKDAQKGIVTDVQGQFSLKLKSGKYVLEISYVGYIPKELEINADHDQIFQLVLKPVITELGEVKITGQKKFFGNMEYGRDIPSIDAAAIEKQNSNNASDILHARLAGVWATKTSGAPGDHEKIRIRGQSSFFSSAEPLYVVDGVPVPIVNLSSLGIADLNIHDIEDVTVLKDASSTALYGFQGGNGVVLIDTKKGGTNRLNFSTRMGYQWFNNFYDLMSTDDFLTSLDSAHSIMNSSLRYRYPAKSDTLCNHDRQSDFFSGGFTQEYQLSASGTKDLLKYYFSGNYTDEEGILPNSNYSRYTFSARLGRLLMKRFAVDLGYRGSRQDNQNNQDEYKGNRLLFEGISKAPCLECTPDSLLYNEIGEINPRTYYSTYKRLSSVELPQSIIDNNHHSLKINTNTIYGIGRIRLTDYLYMDFMESFMQRRTKYESNFTYDNYYTNGTYLGSSEIALKSREDVILFNHQANISYNRNFNNHAVGILMANRYYKDNLWWNVDSLKGTIPEHYSLKNSMAAYGPKGSVLRNMNSWIAHVSYAYRKTYKLSVIGNVSHVKEGLYTNYYSFFPAVAAGWDVSRVRILRSAAWLNSFRVYANWGISGNYPLNGLANDLYIDVPYTLNDSSTSYYPSVLQLANHKLRHEKTRETDYGITGSILDERISFSAVYFTKQIENMILLRDIPLYYGGGKQYLNIGRVAIQGYEFNMGLVPVKRPDYSCSLDFNFSTSKQVVKKLIENEDLQFYDPDILFPDFYVKEGDALGNIYGFRYLGKLTAADMESNSNSFVKVQHEKFFNPDSTDKVLTDKDKVILGNSIPDFTWNLSGTLQYRNFSIDFVWYAAGGIQKYNATRAATMMKGVNRDMNRYVADTLRSILTEYFYESSVFVEDASFIRLKSLTFNYTFNKHFQDRITAEIALSFENLITITKYKGYDPEATTFTDNNFSDNAVDRGAYPNPKAVYFSVHLTF